MGEFCSSTFPKRLALCTFQIVIHNVKTFQSCSLEVKAGGESSFASAIIFKIITIILKIIGIRERILATLVNTYY